MNNSFDNCNDPERYIDLMFENTDPKTGILCFHGLWHMNDGDEVYRFHMNWNADDVENIKRDYRSLIDSLKAIAVIEPEPEDGNVASVITDTDLLNIWNTYMRDFAGDGEYTEEIDEIFDKRESIEIAEDIRQKIQNHEEISKDEEELFKDYEDLALTDEENAMLDRFWDARFREADSRVGKSPFSYNRLILAKRVCKLIRIGAPKILIEHESRELMAAMALHRHCDSREEM